MQWEYKQIEVSLKHLKPCKDNTYIIELLNKYGREGWELANVDNVYLDGYFVYVFKRPISE